MAMREITHWGEGLKISGGFDNYRSELVDSLCRSVDCYAFTEEASTCSFHLNYHYLLVHTPPVYPRWFNNLPTWELRCVER